MIRAKLDRSAVAATVLVCLWIPGTAAGQAKVLRGRVTIGAGPVPSPAGVARNAKTDLHIPQGRRVNSWNHQMSDGAGYRWDIQSPGTVGSGTDNAYGGGMYCLINKATVQWNGNAWLSAADDEMEIGPHQLHNVSAYRRIKVYKDRGLARWLDILQNNTASVLTINVQIRTNTCWQIGTLKTNSGGAVFGAKDWAFTTQTVGGNRAPALLHVVGDKRSKLRPTVRTQNNQLYLDYSVTIPARGVAVLCHFESQNRSLDELAKMMKAFRPRKLLKDLNPSVRKLILNVSSGSELFDIDLERSDASDMVVRKNGDPICGSIKNESFTVKTLFGDLKIPADQVIGMVSSAQQDGSVRFVLLDGQVVGGVPEATRLAVALPTGGELRIPLSDVKQWSYRISRERPEDAPFVGPIAVLRTGDQIAFEPAQTPLQFRTRNGTIPLNPADLMEITLDNPANAVHRARFLNGSVLAGFLEPANLALTLKLGRELEVPRDLVSRIRFALEEKPDPGLTYMLLTNGDELYGRLDMESLTVESDIGAPQIKRGHIKAVRFSPTHLGRVVLDVWPRSVLRGQLKDPELKFEICRGCILTIYANQIVGIVRPSITPPEQVVKRVAELVALLGAESYQDRNRATEELCGQDPAIAPLLRKHLKSSDPEVRQRIEEILEKLGADPEGPTNPPPLRQGEFILRGFQGGMIGPR